MILKFIKRILGFEKEDDFVKPKVITTGNYKELLYKAMKYKKRSLRCPECGYYSESYNPETGVTMDVESSIFSKKPAGEYVLCICPNCDCEYEYRKNSIYEYILKEESYYKPLREEMEAWMKEKDRKKMIKNYDK
jgi:DNA-directed RNA polymerase subunit M/transcription elongation factor TFIIS